MARFCLENGSLRVEVGTWGAELLSMRVLSDGTELLWQGHEGTWNRTAPVVFPVLGSLPDNAYYLDGKRYPMQKNGLARTMEFSPVVVSDDVVELELQSDAETLRQYPYDFTLTVLYRLCKDSLEIAYTVKNRSNRPMPYVLGAHPGFVWPRNSDRKSYIRFAQSEYAPAFRPDGHRVLLLDRTDTLTLEPEMFRDGAYSTDAIRSHWLELYPAGCRWKLRIVRSDFSFLTFWSMDDNQAEFVCIEPTLGAGGFGAGLQERYGMQELSPGGSAAYRLSIQVIPRNTQESPMEAPY